MYYPRTMLMGLTAEFVKSLNNTISSVGSMGKEDIEKVEALRNRISEIMKLFNRSEENVKTLLLRVESNTPTRKDEIVYVRKDGNLQAIISPTVIKPIIKPVPKLEHECNCHFYEFEHFESLKGYFVVETEEELRRLDSSLSAVCLEVFEHDYRSFEGFSCFIAIYTQSGCVYIVDAITFRDVIPQLRLLSCQVRKIVHCQGCVERLIKDFGHIGCYWNFNVTESQVYIDWRIRPLNETLASIICQSIQESVESSNDRIPPERHEPSPTNEIQEFAEKFNLPPSLDILADLLKLRVYLARKNDESIQYVITDNQLYNLIINNPSNIEEFEHLFERMSSVLRLHADDFLLILKKRSKIFSVESLKYRQSSCIEYELCDTIDEKHRRLDTVIDNSSLMHEIEEESSLHVSTE